MYNNTLGTKPAADGQVQIYLYQIVNKAFILQLFVKFTRWFIKIKDNVGNYYQCSNKEE